MCRPRGSRRGGARPRGARAYLAIHRARPDGTGWDRAHLNVRLLAEAAALPLERNSVCVSVLSRLNRSFIDLQAILDEHQITHEHNIELPSLCSQRDAHYQCSFGQRYEPRPGFFKRPFNGDCRDLASLNVVQLILSSLCGQPT